MIASPLVKQCLREVMRQYEGDELYLVDIGQAIADIVTRNNHRIPENATPNQETGVPDSYVSEVVTCFKQECERYFLLALNDEQMWREVLEFSSRRVVTSMRFFCLSEPLIEQQASDLAQHCTTLVWQKLLTYPFDCAFDAWVSVFVVNEVRRFTFSKEVKRLRKMISLDQPVTSNGDFQLAEYLPDRTQEIEQERIEWKLAIERHVPALSRDQREVIYRQLAGQDNKQIAAALGKPLNAIYNIRNRALVRLQALIS